MRKNPTTPPKGTRQSQRGRDNTNPLWAPKGKENASPRTQRKRKIGEIEDIENKAVQIKFFKGATKQGSALLKLMNKALDAKREELQEIEDSQVSGALVMPQLEFDQYLAPGMWRTVTGPAMAEEGILAEGLTTEESSEVSSDNESGLTTPRSMTPII